jgi:hypothetical protein
MTQNSNQIKWRCQLINPSYSFVLELKSRLCTFVSLQQAPIYAKITILTTEDPGINKKTWCGHWHAWGEICDLYFQKIASNPSSPRWFVDREAYRGRPRHPSQIKPDLVVKMLMPAQPQQNLPSQVNSRDFLLQDRMQTGNRG